jgi:hypothetical protein
MSAGQASSFLLLMFMASGPHTPSRRERPKVGLWSMAVSLIQHIEKHAVPVIRSLDYS